MSNNNNDDDDYISNNAHTQKKPQGASANVSSGFLQKKTSIYCFWIYFLFLIYVYMWITIHVWPL